MKKFLTAALVASISSFATAQNVIENFDAAAATPAGWTQSLADTFDWTIQSGSTTSSATGPTSDHTSGSGNYAFIETSSPRVVGDNAILEGPIVNSLVPNPSLLFWAHMYGATTGSLTVEAFDGAAWVQVWTLSGDQGNTWFPVSAALPTFGANQVQVRFIAVSGTSFTGDIAIDDVEIGRVVNEWQVNQRGSSLDVNGVTVATAAGGSAARTVVPAGNLVTYNLAAPAGLGFEVAIAPSAAVPGSNPAALISANGQVVNVDLSTPGMLFLNGGTGLGFIPHPGALALNFVAPLADFLVTAQQVTLDPSNADGIALSQAAELEVTTNVELAVITGDDTFQNVVLNTPILVNGAIETSLDVCTNGWIKTGANATSSDFSENADDFVNGVMGLGTPATSIAVLWEDLDMGNGANQRVVVSQNVITGAVKFEWQNADYFPATPIGTFSCTIDNVTPGATTNIKMDYTGFTGNAMEGIVGVSDGTLLTATPVATDLVVGGAVAPYLTAGSAESVFQSFDGLGGVVAPIAAESIDVGGLMINFADYGVSQWLIN